MKNYILLGSRIKEVRTNQKLTQENLADAVNLSPHFLSQIENGKRKASLDSLFNIASALNIPVSYLFAEPKSSQKNVSNKIETTIAKLNPHEKDMTLNILREITSEIIKHRKFK
jgi:transcriptional regulator with XRE-family HTH domain